MSDIELNQQTLKSMTLYALKTPIIYFSMGLLLTFISYIDDLFNLPKWQAGFNTAETIGHILLILSFIAFIYRFCVRVCYKYENRLLPNYLISSLILKSVRKSLKFIFLIIIFNVIIPFLQPTRFYLMLADNILNTFLIATLGWLALQVLYTSEAVFYQQMVKNKNHDSTRMKSLYTKIHIIRNSLTVIIILVTVAAILMSFESVRSIGVSLLASAGFITAIAGLSSQKALASFFSGLQIALSQTIKIGDMVTIEHLSGVIEEITFTYVRLKTNENKEIIVPISYFTEKPFETWDGT